MSLSAAKQLTCWLQICPCPGSNTYCHLLLMKLRDVVWCKWRVSFCHSCHSSPCCNELSDWVRILPFARAWHAICWACSCTWAKAGVAGGGGPGPLTQTWLSAVSATGCSSNAGVEAMSLPFLQGEGGWDVLTRKAGCFAVQKVVSSQEASCYPQDSVSALLEQTAVELEAVEKKLEESRSTLTSGESW